MQISLARRTDIPALIELLSQLFNQEAEFRPEPERQRSGLQAILDNESVGTLLVAREDDRIVGMINLLYTVSTALGGPVALLEDMVVAPPFRGRGIGSALLNQAVAWARDKDCQRITLLTDHDNTGAQRFYARHGFECSSMVAMRRALPRKT